MNYSLNRRKFISTVGIGVASQLIPGNLEASTVHPLTSTEKKNSFRTDRRFYKFKGPWRKVHLDFHNSKYVPKIGAKFNANQWGDRVVEGNLDSIVVFAKDMHGYFYYPSKYGPVHPGLSFDLLGAQVKACRERDIKVYAYYCTAWDNYLADKHPEWNMRKKDGSDYRPKEGQTPAWTALCLGNKELVDLIASHVREFVSIYPLDGVWLDMAEPIGPECYCAECVRQLKSAGLDPNEKEVQRAHQNKNFLNFHRRMRELVKSIKPDCQIDFNDTGLGKVSERAELLDSIDIEALPTGGWGYFYAPAQIRYQRNFGLPVYGMTGRFAISWADFGGLKLPQQLDVELASLVSTAARCDIGDQMPPEGELDAAVYHVLGKSFGRIKQIEPWLNEAAPVCEAVLLLPGTPMQTVNQSELFGLVKLMMEAHLQFDLMELEQAWEDYQLVVIPDELKPDGQTVKRLEKYIANGGAVIACHHGGVQKETGLSWLEKYGLSYKGSSEFKPAYLVTDDRSFENLPPYAYALYGGASQWEVKSPAKSLAKLGVPLFQRSAAHFTSHNQTPFDHVTEFSALAVSSRVGLAGFPLGNSYFEKGYWVYRSAFDHLLRQVLPVRLVETNAPLSTEINVTYQEANSLLNRPERYLVHLINWSPNRKTPQHPEVHEDPIALTDIRVKLNLPLKNAKVKTVFSGEVLPVKIAEGGIEVQVSRIVTSEIISFEVI